MYIGLLTFQQNLNFLDSFSKTTRMSNFMNICPVEAEVFHADGRTDMGKLIFAFHNFANTPKNSTFCPHTLFVWPVFISEQTALIRL